MNINGVRDDLLNCLQKVSGTAQSANINPILANVLLEADKNALCITATDQETQIKSHCQVTANKKFNTTVSAKKFQDILTRLDANGEVVFEYQEAKKEGAAPTIKISSGKTQYKLLTLPTDEFPLLGEKEKFKPLFSIPANDLLRTLKRVSYACAINSHRLNLNGVLIEGSINGFHVVATDGHRMAVQKLCEEKDEKQLTLPRKSINELIRNLPSAEESVVNVKASDRFVRFESESFELTSSVISERFPDYQSVVPLNNDKKITVDKKILLTGLQRVSAICDKDATVIMNIDKNHIKLECINKLKETADDELIAKHDGSPIQVGFNIGFLIDMLLSLEESAIIFNILEASSSVLITVAEDEKTEFQYVVMPVRL